MPEVSSRIRELEITAGILPLIQVFSWKHKQNPSPNQRPWKTALLTGWALMCFQCSSFSIASGNQKEVSRSESMQGSPSASAVGPGRPGMPTVPICHGGEGHLVGPLPRGGLSNESDFPIWRMGTGSEGLRFSGSWLNYKMNIKFRLGYLTLKRIFISLSITPSRLIHVVANSRISMFCIVLFYCKYVIKYFLDSFIHWWTLCLFQYLGYCE